MLVWCQLKVRYRIYNTGWGWWLKELMIKLDSAKAQVPKISSLIKTRTTLCIYQERQKVRHKRLCENLIKIWKMSPRTISKISAVTLYSPKMWRAITRQLLLILVLCQTLTFQILLMKTWTCQNQQKVWATSSPYLKKPQNLLTNSQEFPNSTIPKVVITSQWCK